jgi:predicted porin
MRLDKSAVKTRITVRSAHVGLVVWGVFGALLFAQTAMAASPTMAALQQEIDQLQADAVKRDAALKQAQQDLAALRAQVADSAQPATNGQSATAGQTGSNGASSTPVADLLAKLPDDGSLTYMGITLYGTIDADISYQSHGAPHNDYYTGGVPYVIAKNSNKSTWAISDNGLSQSKLGLSGKEALTDDLSAVFKFETGFQPTSGNLTSSPQSLVQNNGKALNAQSTNGDSSRAGQAFQGAAYIGVSSKEFGTLTIGRLNSLILDDLLKYDPQLQSYAFSIIGLSGTAAGGGDTEDARLDQSIKYALIYGPVHVAYIHQFGSAGSLPGGADEADIGGSYSDPVLGEISLDATWAHVKDAVQAGSLSAAQLLTNPATSLTGTISNNDTLTLEGFYKYGPLKFYGGYEHIQFENPSSAIAAGTSTIGGYELSVINNNAYARHKLLDISWGGVRYSVLPQFDLTGAYYHYNQNSYSGNGCTNNSAGSCAGTEDVYSLVADYRLTKRWDVYAGFMYSSVGGGLANGYLKTYTWGPASGGRFSF